MKGKQTAFTYVLALEDKPQLATYESYICAASIKINKTGRFLFRRSGKFCVALPLATRLLVEREKRKKKQGKSAHAVRHALYCFIGE